MNVECAKVLIKELSDRLDQAQTAMLVCRTFEEMRSHREIAYRLIGELASLRKHLCGT